MPRLVATALAALIALAVAPSAATAAGPHGPSAHSHGLWSPGRFDTCPARLHDRHAVRGPRGKVYPTWHPPRVRRPASNRRCTFGHEHGRDPRGSDVYRWIARRFGGGLPFGAANEALDAYARDRGKAFMRHEDHVGHKVEWRDDVRLVRGRGRARTAVSCDFLTKVHQGSHSADAFASNVHELVYALRCDDGTRLLTTTLVRFGHPGVFRRGCEPNARILTGVAPPFPPGPGRRLIPDRTCVDRHIIVPSGERSLFARGLHETWLSRNRIATRSGRTVARWSPRFAVLNPSRYHDPSDRGGIARTLDLCWEVGPTGDRAAGSACDAATAHGSRTHLPWDHPGSPFDGTHRDTSLGRTTLSNRPGRPTWHTDPYGLSASRRPFPGSIPQLVAPTRARLRPTPSSRSYGSERPYDAPGVHAPN